MKDFLISNAGVIGGAVGLIILLGLLLSSKYWGDTKWGYPIVFSLTVMGALKFIDICEAIAKFLAK